MSSYRRLTSTSLPIAGIVCLQSLFACAPVKRNFDDLMTGDAGDTSAGGSDGKGGRSSTGQGGKSGASTTEKGGSTSGGRSSTGGGGQGGTALGGSTGSGGTTSTGGTNSLGGGTSSTSTGGTSTSCGTVENCTDGIDNDCNGTIDCPVVSNRYPEVGRASAGDDAMVRLLTPAKTLLRVECRADKTAALGSKPWTTCNTVNPTNLTLYAMGDAAAKLDVTNGVVQFEFRFVYTDSTLSDSRSITFYSHNSLYDGTPGTATWACPPAATDDAYFKAASDFLVAGTSPGTFTPADVQLKNPFIYLTFSPGFIGSFVANSLPQEVKVSSLRHRFLVDANRQLLLVTRNYYSRRAGNKTCAAASIQVHDKYYQGLTINRDHGRFWVNRCDAIVLNKAGTGVCLKVGTTGVVTIVDENSGPIASFLSNLKINWPKADPMMWQKLFDDRPGRRTLQFFSEKCNQADAACLLLHPVALVLPDAGHAYFSNP